MRASVVIAAFNAAPTLETAVCSALAQTEADLEVLIVNDRSTDATESIANALASADARVRLLQNTGPRGPSAARNTAIKASRGDWIVVLDSDDTMSSDRIARLIAQAEARGLDALADNVDLIDFDTGLSKGHAFPERIMVRDDPIDLEWLLLHDMPGSDHRTFGCCKPILRTKALADASLAYDDAIMISEDYLLYGRMVIAGLRFGLTPDCGYRYSLRSSSLIHSSKGSDAHVAVNSRLREVWLQSTGAAPSKKTLDLFRRREAAFRYVDLVYAIKGRELAHSLRSARKLKVGFAVQRIAENVQRRLSRPSA